MISGQCAARIVVHPGSANPSENTAISARNQNTTDAVGSVRVSTRATSTAAA